MPRETLIKHTINKTIFYAYPIEALKLQNKSNQLNNFFQYNK